MATQAHEDVFDPGAWALAIRRRWWWVAVAATVGAVLVGAVLVLVADPAPVYAAETILYVPLNARDDRVPLETHSALALRDSVIARLGAGRGIRRDLRATVDVGPRTLRLRAEADSPLAAHALVTAWQTSIAAEVPVEMYVAPVVPSAAVASVSRRPGLIIATLVLSVGAGLVLAGRGSQRAYDDR